MQKAVIAPHGDRQACSRQTGIGRQMTESLHLSDYRVILTCALRYWRQHKRQAILMLISIALGVSVVFSVDIANHSAKRAFALSLDAVTGRTTHQITAGTSGIDENIYTQLRTELGMRNSAPVIEGTITILSNEHSQRSLGGEDADSDNIGENIQLIGVDMFAEPMFRNQLDNLQDNSSANSGIRDRLALLQPGTILLADTTAKRLGLQINDVINVVAKGHTYQLHLLNLLVTGDQPVPDNLALTDIGTAQSILDFDGRLSRIDLVIENDADIARDLARISKLSDGLSITEASRRNNALQQMTTAFHTNLLAMSLLAILVGAFLIYNTATLSVLERRTVFGQMRLLGVQRGDLFIAILLEVAGFAIVGIIAGLILGYALGGVLLHLVTRTINDLYFTLDVRRLDVSTFSIFKAVFIGLVAALVATLMPAREAANTAPISLTQRSTLESSTRKLIPLISMLGIGGLVIGFIILWLSHSLWAAFLALFLIVLGYSMLIPKCLLLLTDRHKTSKPSSSGKAGLSGTMGQYPLRSLGASLSRTAVAIAALVIAVSATAGVGIMIGSFRTSVADWLDQSLQADIYLRDAQSIDNLLPDTLLPSLSAIDSISGTRRVRLLDIDIEGLPSRLMSLQLTGDAKNGFSFLDNNSNAARSELWLEQGAIYITEPLASSHAVKVGDTLRLQTDNGELDFSIAGIFTDYAAGSGMAVIAQDHFKKHWHTNKTATTKADKNTDNDVNDEKNNARFNTLGINIRSDASQSASQQSIEKVRQLANQHGLLMRSNSELRDLSLNIFDRTFAITHVLRLLTVGVAFVGILSALMALSFERSREFAVLRSLGVTPPELRKLLYLQTGLMGLIAGVLAIPLGILMSYILVSVINLRSFGWTMQFQIAPIVLLESLLLAGIAALLAGCYPAWKLSRMSPAEALRQG